MSQVWIGKGGNKATALSLCLPCHKRDKARDTEKKNLYGNIFKYKGKFGITSISSIYHNILLTSVKKDDLR